VLLARAVVLYRRRADPRRVVRATVSRMDPELGAATLRALTLVERTAADERAGSSALAALHLQRVLGRTSLERLGARASRAASRWSGAPNNSATMVLLLARPVPGESIFLFAPDSGVPASTSHPFRVVRFTNDSKGLLERGPIAVFENGAFLGQGMVDPLPPGATATVPFALERSLAVESTRAANEEGARLAKIEAGRLEIERDWVTHTKYTVKNGGDSGVKVLIKHARQYDTRLHDPPKGTEDNVGTGSALVPLSVDKRA